MAGFKLTSKYKPLGDQPKAIDSLISGLQNNNRDQTLLGITIPHTTIESLYFDSKTQAILWKEAINKLMSKIKNLKA